MDRLNYFNWFVPDEFKKFPRSGYEFIAKYVIGNARNIVSTATKVSLLPLIQNKNAEPEVDDRISLQRIYTLKHMVISLRIWLQQQPQSITDFYLPQIQQLYNCFLNSLFVTSTKLGNVLPLRVAYIHLQERAISLPAIKIIELEDEICNANDEQEVPSKKEEESNSNHNDTSTELTNTFDDSHVELVEDLDQKKEYDTDDDRKEEIQNYKLRRAFVCDDLTANEESEDKQIDWSVHNALYKYEADKLLYRKQWKLRVRRYYMKRLCSREQFRTAPAILPLREIPLSLRTIHEEEEEEEEEEQVAQPPESGCCLMRALRRLRHRSRRPAHAAARPRAPLWQRLLLGICCVGVEED